MYSSNNYNNVSDTHSNYLISNQETSYSMRTRATDLIPEHYLQHADQKQFRNDHFLNWFCREWNPPSLTAVNKLRVFPRQGWKDKIYASFFWPSTTSLLTIRLKCFHSLNISYCFQLNEIGNNDVWWLR